jgi:hypothetical protein
MARGFAAIALAAAVGCGSMPRPPIGAPQDSYTPRQFAVEIAGASSTVDGAAITPRFFTTESVQPLIGRFFVAQEYAAPAQSQVVVISHALWKSRLAGNPATIGSSIVVDGQRRVIVGIAPEMFRPDKGGSIWIPGGG